MKKKLFFIFLFLTICISVLPLSKSYLINAEEVQPDLDIKSPSALLMEESTGAIIYQKNAEQKMYPASMTKMMSMLLVLEKIKSGKMSFSDIVTCSPYAASMGGTQIYLEPGETMSVEDLFKAVSINSANDAVTALGEAVSGSIPEFVKLMNNRAKELKMANTNFANPTGFHDPEHYTTARDMGLLARQLLTFEKEITRFSSMYDGYIRENTPNPFWLVNTNKLVKFYQGMDGLKTGYTSDSLYCLTATAKRNNLRFISVVMRAESIDVRSQDTTKLLDYGFANYQSHVLYAKDDKVDNIKFEYSKDKSNDIYSSREVRIAMPKGEKFESLKVKLVITKISAPIKKGDEVGYIEITNTKGWVAQSPVYVKDDVVKLNWFIVLQRTLSNLLGLL